MPAKPPRTPKRKSKWKKALTPPLRSPKSPRLRVLKRTAIWSTSALMRKVKRSCTWMEVFKSLRTTFPTLFTFADRSTVQRWAFAQDAVTQKNRGTKKKDPELAKAIMDRWADPTIDDAEKTSRKMANYFTEEGTPVHKNFIQKVYRANDLYPARETEELDLRQHHHRRLRVHFAEEHRRMSAEEWEAWVSSDEAIIYMKKTLNPKNNVKWVKKGTKRPNPRPTPKGVPSLKVWGAVGGKGQKSKLHCFRTIMTAPYYRDPILKKYAEPFFKKIKEDYADAVYWQDNDPKHTPNEAYGKKKFKRFTAKPPSPCRCNIRKTGKRGRPKSDPVEECICDLPDYEYHAANSADLPPIENIWSILLRNIWRGNPKIKTLDQLEKATQKAWRAIKPKEILKIQHSLPKRMKLVIASEGWPIDY